MEAGYALNKSASPQLGVTTIITNYNIGQLHVVIHPPDPCVHSCGVAGSPFGHFSQGLK